MSPELIGVLGIVLFLVLILLRMNVGFALAIVGFLGMTLIRNVDYAISVIGSAPFQNLNAYTMTVIPMFTLMGMIIAESRIGSGLYRAAAAWLGHLKGGLASATVVACGILGAITGGQYGATVIMGNIAHPEMKLRGYSDELSSGSIAAGAPLAIIIPPSIPMIIFGILTETSVGDLFIAGIIPGILTMIAFVVMISLICWRNPKLGPASEKMKMKDRLKASKDIIAVVILIIVVMGSIYTGICTTTESGAIGVIGAFLIALFMGDVSWPMLKKCFLSTVKTAGMFILLLAGTYIFVSFIAVSKIPFAVTNFILSFNIPYWLLILGVLVIYFLLGMIMPEAPIMMLTVPILWPVFEALGASPIWLGIICVKMLALGGFTPPVGMVAYILSGTTKVPLTKVFKGSIPFIVADLIVILILCFFPILSTWLPGLGG